MEKNVNIISPCQYILDIVEKFHNLEEKMSKQVNNDTIEQRWKLNITR